MSSDNANLNNMLESVKEILLSAKAENIDTFFNSVVGSTFLVISASSERHVKALLSAVKLYVKSETDYKYKIEGDNTCTWVIMEIFDINITINIFRKEVREYYDVDHLWSYIKNNKIQEAVDKFRDKDDE